MRPTHVDNTQETTANNSKQTVALDHIRRLIFLLQYLQLGLEVVNLRSKTFHQGLLVADHRFVSTGRRRKVSKGLLHSRFERAGWEHPAWLAEKRSALSAFPTAEASLTATTTTK